MPRRWRIRRRSGAEYPNAANFLASSHDTIPNFAQTPDILSIKSGNWEDTTTWSTSQVPTASDIVGIKTTHTVTITGTTAAALVLGIAGTLSYSRAASTKLTVTTVLVYETTGSLDMGTAASPIPSQYTAELVIRDSAIDTGTVESPGSDPAQYGHGLLVRGLLSGHGASKTPFARVSVEPLAAATSCTFGSAVSGWAVGDELVIPDTRQLREGERFSSYASKWENKLIDSLASGNTVANLTTALAYDHKGARLEDNSLDRLPHVGNLTRNVIIRSEDGTGVRGHVMFLDRAEIDIRGVRFKELGRTSNATLNSTTFDGGGNPTAIGTNQIGRYAIHCHHLYGPVGGLGYDATVDPPEFEPANILNTYGCDGASYRLVDCVIDDPLPASPSNSMPASKWATTIHGSHFGLVKRCVMHHYAGANLMTEDASETGNVIEENFSCNCIGDVTERNTDGRAGSGFFFSGFGHYVRNNVSAGNACTFQEIVSGTGFYYFVNASGGLTLVDIPDFQGADPNVDGTQVDARTVPILQFEDNEAYGAMATGMTIWHLGSDGYSNIATDTSTITNLTCWHCWEEGWFGYPCQSLVFDGLIVRGADASANAFDKGKGFTFGDYWCGDVTIKNADIQGMYRGIYENLDVHGTLTIQDSVINCVLVDVEIGTHSTPGSGVPGANHATVIDNVLFNQWGADAGFKKLSANYKLSFGNVNLRVTDTIAVTDFDQVVGDNFNLYYDEQASTFEMPQTGEGGLVTVGCPEAGLTNAQAYVAYNQDGTAKTGGALSDPTGCCIGGVIAPAGTTTRAGVDGLIEEL